MNDEYSWQLLLIDRDQIFRLGLRTICQQFADLEVVAEADSRAGAEQVLAARSETVRVDLVILDLVLDMSNGDPLQICQLLKTRYYDLPVLLLTAIQDATVLRQAQVLGVNGYCPKGIAVPELVRVIRLVAAGENYWELASSSGSRPLGFVARVGNSWRLSGLRQIAAARAKAIGQLQNPALSPLSRAILVGRLRELQTASWLLNQLFAPQVQNKLPVPISPIIPNTVAVPQKGSEIPNASLSCWSFSSQQASLFPSMTAKLGWDLQNLTGLPLEIDILREEKKRELLYTILRQLEKILNELHFGQVELSQLKEQNWEILHDLWSESTRDFFGKYYRVQVGDRSLDLLVVLLQDAPVVRTTILNKIPLVMELFSHLLYEQPLIIDNAPYSAGTPEAIARAAAVMENLIIQVANGVVQPLLNNFADVMAIKSLFYDRELISTRAIERFRNNLSWKYRYEQLFAEPKAIFESQYILFGFDSRGIKKISIYAPRRPELEKLTGWQQAVTLALEIRDAIEPRLRSFIAFVGSSIVYILTQVIGRGIGLIGRGILRGIGNSWSENQLEKNGERQK
ncbi:MAG: DUF3685 domain-containing protein [Hormoscilla sp. GM7CHS1pb]|nr:DUF3685 domain-containing protein [Hormoscilla sp. GM7CHS1pb]